MNIPKVEEFLGLTIGKDVLKQAMGDGPEFDLVYEAMLSDRMEDMNSKDNSKDSEDSSFTYTASGSGQRLQDIPLRIRTEPIKTGELILGDTNKIDSKINNDDSKVYYAENTSTDMDKIYNSVDKYSSKYGVDRNLILAIIKQESNFNPNAISSAGAKGLMQLMDFNSEAYGVENPYDIDENINAGVKHIKSYLNMYNGNVEMALMAYNAGPGTMARRGVNSPSDLYKMPEETQNYVPKIMEQLV